jgi:DNA-binding winged helix-turn-helix (wHTH) protein
MPGPELWIGGHRLDLERHVLRRAGVVVPLQAQPCRLLVLLVQRAGSLVTREEICAHLWGDTVVAYDQSINFCIRQIRVALADDAAVVQTVPRRGYRIAQSAVRPAVRPVELGAVVRTVWVVRAPVAAAAAVAALLSGFTVGSLKRDAHLLEFVSGHLAHPDRCPYLRFFVRTPPNS